MDPSTTPPVCNIAIHIGPGNKGPITVHAPVWNTSVGSVGSSCTSSSHPQDKGKKKAGLHKVKKEAGKKPAWSTLSQAAKAELASLYGLGNRFPESQAAPVHPAMQPLKQEFDSARAEDAHTKLTAECAQSAYNACLDTYWAASRAWGASDGSYTYQKAAEDAKEALQTAEDTLYAAIAAAGEAVEKHQAARLKFNEVRRAVADKILRESECTKSASA